MRLTCSTSALIDCPGVLLAEQVSEPWGGLSPILAAHLAFVASARVWISCATTIFKQVAQWQMSCISRAEISLTVGPRSVLDTRGTARLTYPANHYIQKKRASGPFALMNAEHNNDSSCSLKHTAYGIRLLADQVSFFNCFFLAGCVD